MIENIFNLSAASILSLKQLRAAPTPARWRDELQAILSGDRDEVIENVGSPRQYVLRLCADSSLPNDCRETFMTALNAVVAEWVPEQNSVAYNALLLSLFQHFRPLHGSRRILSYLLPGNSIWFPSGSDARSLRTTKAALAALEAYWTLPPEDVTEPAFSMYARLIKRHLEEPSDELTSHCFRRLLEMRLLNFDKEQDRVLADKVIGIEGVLIEFLQYALGVHRGLLEDHIGSVLALCLNFRDDSVEEQPYIRYASFVGILRRLGASIVEFPHNRPVAIQLVDESRIAISLPEDSRMDFEQASSYDNDQEFSRVWGPLKP